MAAQIFRTVLRGAALGTMVWGYQSLGGLAIDQIMRAQYGGHLQYLTIQGLALACLTMATGLLNDLLPVFGTIKRSFMIIALPLSVVISSIYWSLIIFMPDLILQALPGDSAPSSSSDAPAPFRIPLSMDLALHAVPCISLILDFSFFEKKYTKYEVKLAPIVAVVFSLWYTLWVEHCGKMNNGIFPYPFLTENPLNVRIGIYIGATLLSIFSFRAINALHP
ncbi:hypothetical protein D9613_002984 [Agrocybe pediades]|uniref:Uncharacterized protein n=1 Tax=Agrocybe pediades TaxID=84607 RepID=A0A8H4VM23_9AGAR|nr:hypothetical protein D9613_002984 [Agrocybe pediades]KAF9567528.1 hypothetical protein CPC08DRAFT_703068 [Agrocybe pediades]